MYTCVSTWKYEGELVSHFLLLIEMLYSPPVDTEIPNLSFSEKEKEIRDGGQFNIWNIYTWLPKVTYRNSYYYVYCGVTLMIDVHVRSIRNRQAVEKLQPLGSIFNG